MDIKPAVRTFILDNFLFGDDSRLQDDDASFLENSIVDSTGFLELISFLEKTFDIRVEDDELLPENLDSLGNIEAFVTRKKS